MYEQKNPDAIREVSLIAHGVRPIAKNLHIWGIETLGSTQHDKASAAVLVLDNYFG